MDSPGTNSRRRVRSSKLVYVILGPENSKMKLD
jgi:hypothetical protein